MSEENIEIGWSDFLGNPIHLDVKWKSFEEARAFARSLNLKNRAEWNTYHKENKPEGMPRNPHLTYKDKGWKGMGDFLGTGNKSTYEWKPFEEARDFARSLKLKGQKEWFAYHKENKPEGIPAAPHQAYKDKGWKGMGDFLGTGNRRSGWKPFEEARAFARSLNLKNRTEWNTYHRENKPEAIPSAPWKIYKGKEWKGMGDFLGTGNTRTKDWLPFEEAREFARSLNLKNRAEWNTYHKENKPEGIPSNPNVVYKEKGWKGMGDFLGTGNKSTYDWKSFEEARDFARSLKLKGQKEWRSYHRENKPEGIPSNTHIVYKGKGWTNWGDFLGTGNKSTYEWKPFEEARAFARSLKLKSQKEWFAYHKENKPEGIPQSPNIKYKDKGWISWGDFLGTGNVHTKEWLPFKEARTFARSLNLKGAKEWSSYHKENKPEGIPSAPHQAYKDKGWNGWGDFLGTGNKKGGWLPFEEARAFSRSLNLKSEKEWNAYHKDNKPEGIPQSPYRTYKDKGWSGYKDFLGN